MNNGALDNAIDRAAVILRCNNIMNVVCFAALAGPSENSNKAGERLVSLEARLVPTPSCLRRCSARIGSSIKIKR